MIRAPRGRSFFHSPGPTNIPERVLAAMHRPTIDFAGPEFARIKAECFEGLRAVFKTARPTPVYASSGHGGWEAALVNVCSPGDRILIPETGGFAEGWKETAEALGIAVDYLPGDWRHGVDADAVEARLAEDREHRIKAVALVHTDTATGITSDCEAVRRAIDRAHHPALFLVDAIASLATAEFRMDDWGVDVAIAASQKGFMLPAGLAFTCVSEKALRACESARLPRRYWDWRERLPDGETVRFSGTAPVHMFFGLQEALRMIFEEGLDAVIARHARLAAAVRAAVRAWGADGGIEIVARRPAEQASSVTAILLPEGADPEAVRAICRERFNLLLGAGLRRLNGRAFRIGHLGDLNEPMILGALATTELALRIAGVPHRAGGVDAAVAALADARAESAAAPHRAHG